MDVHNVNKRDDPINNEIKNDDCNCEDNKLQDMTASYTEISFDSQLSPQISDLNRLIKISKSSIENYSSDNFSNNYLSSSRPNHLILKTNCDDEVEKNSNDLISCQKAMNYLQSEGTVTNDGHLVLFVVEDLENKIKLSSPVQKKSESLRLNETRFFPSCLYIQTPSVPAVDQNILNELENEARKIATSVDSITENLAAILHSASALTVCCLETYRDAVCKTCDNIDYNIKSMYQLMAKCEELTKSMEIFYKMAERTKDIKKMLELFENSTNS